MKNHTDENLLRRLFAYFVGQIASVLLTTGKSAALTFRRKKVTFSLVAISLVVHLTLFYFFFEYNRITVLRRTGV